MFTNIMFTIGRIILLCILIISCAQAPVTQKNFLKQITSSSDISSVPKGARIYLNRPSDDSSCEHRLSFGINSLSEDWLKLGCGKEIVWERNPGEMILTCHEITDEWKHTFGSGGVGSMCFPFYVNVEKGHEYRITVNNSFSIFRDTMDPYYGFLDNKHLLSSFLDTALHLHNNSYSQDMSRLALIDQLLVTWKEEAVDPLIYFLRHNMDESVRAYCAEILGSTENKRAIKPLIEALNDTDGAVRMNAAYSLGDINDISAIDPLIRTITNCNYVNNIRICEASKSSLKKITGQDFGENKEKWQEWWNRNKEQLPSQAVMVPTKKKVVVRFMKNIEAGGEVGGIFDGESFIGEISPNSQFDYLADQGSHLFIVKGEDIESYLKADLEADKTYYVFIEEVKYTITTEETNSGESAAGSFVYGFFKGLAGPSYYIPPPENSRAVKRQIVKSGPVFLAVNIGSPQWDKIKNNESKLHRIEIVPEVLGTLDKKYKKKIKGIGIDKNLVIDYETNKSNEYNWPRINKEDGR